MCGIAGVMLFEPSEGMPLSRIIRRMNAAQEQRGPDDADTYVSGQCALGSVRLQITGTPTIGCQPIITDHSGLVYNGEVYGASAANAWDGSELVKILEERNYHRLTSLNAMFAAARYDSKTRTLQLVRDYIGKKPLYVARFPNGIAFASTVAAISVALGGLSIREASIFEYLVFKSVGANASAFERVEQLRPGSWLEIKADGSQQEGSWWSVPWPSQERVFEAQKLRNLVVDATRIRTTYRPTFGLFLSGGLDSSIVALCSSSEPCVALSIGYQGRTAADERIYAQTLARSLNLQFEHIEIAPSDIPELMRRVATETEDPIQDPITLPTSELARAASSFTKVVLTGDGSDEVWLGYQRFDNAEPTVNAHFARMCLFSPDELGLDCFPPSYHDGWPYAIDASLGLEAIQRFELWFRLRNYHLSRIDKILMANGVECRCPFLDRRVVEYGLTFRSSVLRDSHMPPKYTLIEAFPELPHWLRHRKKQPFTLPVEQWALSHLKPFFQQTLSGGAWIRKFVPAALVKRLLHGQMPNSGMKLWSLAQLEIWRSAIQPMLKVSDRGAAWR